MPASEMQPHEEDNHWGSIKCHLTIKMQKQFIRRWRDSTKLEGLISVKNTIAFDYQPLKYWTRVQKFTCTLSICFVRIQWLNYTQHMSRLNINESYNEYFLIFKLWIYPLNKPVALGHVARSSLLWVSPTDHAAFAALCRSVQIRTYSSVW